MPIEIRETKVIPDGDGAFVQMLISEEPSSGPLSTFSVLLQTRVDLPNPSARTILATIQLFAVQAVLKLLPEIVSALRKAQQPADISQKPVTH